MVMHLAHCLYLLPAFLYRTFIEYQSPDLIAEFRDTARQVQVPLCKQNQDRTPADLLVAQQIIIRVLTAFSYYLLPKLPGKVTVDTLAAVK